MLYMYKIKMCSYRPSLYNSHALLGLPNEDHFIDMFHCTYVIIIIYVQYQNEYWKFKVDQAVMQTLQTSQTQNSQELIHTIQYMYSMPTNYSNKYSICMTDLSCNRELKLANLLAHL